MLPRRTTASLPIADPFSKTAKAALLVIDVQEEFVPEVEAAFPDFEANLRALLAWGRENRIHIVHIRAEYREEEQAGKSAWIPHFRELNPEKSFTALPIPAAFAREEDGEPCIAKPTFCGFTHTSLEENLRDNEIKQLLICGLVTSACVQATAHSAFARGFCPILVEDACADRSRERHESCISLYGGYMYKVTTLESLLKYRK